MSYKIKTISRPNCVLTGNADVDLLYSFKKFPIYVGCTDSLDSSNDLFCNMDWGISKSSGNIQLMNLLDPDLLYKHAHGSGTIGNIWKQHHKKFYNLISKSNFYNVLEIGGASGSLISHFLQDDKEFNWTIIEPSNANTIQDNRVNLVNDFFENYNENKKFDTIVHSHVFEHVYDPIKFLSKIYSMLEDNGNHYITLPNMKYWLGQGYTNTLLFEHTFYVDDQILEYILNKTNFEVVEKRIEEHSIFIHCKKSKNVNVTFKNFDYVKDLYLKYVNHLKQDIEQINQQIKDSKVFLFGGHIFSQTLINLGLPKNQIINILDNDSKKHGKRLYGTDLIVKSPACLSTVESPIVILRGGVYTNEIKQSLLEINSTTRII